MTRLRTLPRPLVAGGVLLAGLVLVALSAPLVAPGDPRAFSTAVLQPPSWSAPLGTDDFGRDQWRAVVHGARVSLALGLLAAAVSLGAGVVVGATAGQAGGAVDAWLMRATEFVQVMPRFFLAIVVTTILDRSVLTLALLLGATYWPATARLVRAMVASAATTEYVLAARAVGAGPLRVLVRHVLPSVWPVALAHASFHAGGAILVESGLSFLGLGDPGVVSWGGLLGHAQSFIHEAWWLALFPGLAIALTVLAFNLLADALSGGSRAS